MLLNCFSFLFQSKENKYCDCGCRFCRGDLCYRTHFLTKKNKIY